MKKITALLIVLCWFVPAVFAQTGGQTSSSAAQTITLDNPVIIHLVGSTPVNLTYQSNGGEAISVTARMVDPTSAIDPMVTLMDSNGATLAFNDDHDAPDPNLSDRDAVIPTAALTTAGTYTIQVASFSDTGEGDVEVTVSAGQSGAAIVLATPDVSGSSSTPSLNTQTIQGTVPADTAYTTTVQFTEGDVVTISVHATDNTLDPKLALLDSSGNQVAYNDDQTTDPSLGAYDSQIANFTIPKTDTYTIQINGFAGVGGPFELTIAPGVAGSGTTVAATEQLSTSSTPVPNVNVQTYTGSINANDVYTANFDGQAGDVYTITVQATNSDFDPRVSVYLDSKWIADNDDYGTTDPNLAKTDARIYDLILQNSGHYEVDVRGFQDSAGPFKLTIERVATGAPTGAPTEHVELGSVDASSVYRYQFQAQAGDWVTITARGLTYNFDPYISLASADGTVLFDNDDNGTSDASLSLYDARIPNYHITTTGTYTVEVSGVGGVGGTFGLTISTLRN